MRSAPARVRGATRRMRRCPRRGHGEIHPRRPHVHADGGAGRRHGRPCRRRAGERRLRASSFCTPMPPRRRACRRASTRRSMLANAAIGTRREENPALSGMGCTLIGAVFGPEGIEWVSVGDSPLFLLRNGEIVLFNEDHSLAPEIDKLAAAGKISWEDAQGGSTPPFPALGADGHRDRPDRPVAPAAGAAARRRGDPGQRRHPHARRSRHPARRGGTLPADRRRLPSALLARRRGRAATSTRTTPPWWSCAWWEASSGLCRPGDSVSGRVVLA